MRQTFSCEFNLDLMMVSIGPQEVVDDNSRDICVSVCVLVNKILKLLLNTFSLNALLQYIAIYTAFGLLLNTKLIQHFNQN